MTPIPDLRRRVRPLAWLPPAAMAILLLAGLAAAGGSGYSQSYTRRAGSVSDSSVDLVSVSTSDPGGANISVNFQVSGHLNMASQTTGYYVWFGGSSQSNSSAWIFFVDNATFGTIYTSSSFTTSSVAYTLGNGGSSASFSVAKAVVGPSSTFAVNVFAWSGSTTSASESWLGTSYSGSNGGLCNAAGCVTPASTALAFGTILLYALLSIVIIVVVVVVVILLVMRRKKAAGMAPGTPPMGNPPYPQAPPPPPPPPPAA